MTTQPGRADEGLGCRTLSLSLAILVGFAVMATSTGLALTLADAPSAAGERFGLTLYAAGAPISGLFAVLAGELPVAPLTDIVVWIVAAVFATRLSDRRGTPLWKPLVVIVATALVWGVVASSALERV